MPPDGDEVEFMLKEVEKINVKRLEPSFGAVIGLEYFRDDMESALRRVVYSKSFKPSRWHCKFGAVFDHTPQNVTLYIMKQVVFTALLCTTKNAWKGNSVVFESAACGPRVHPCFNNLESFMFPDSFEDTESFTESKGAASARADF